jgi:membrane-bound ClpP family serine protease
MPGGKVLNELFRSAAYTTLIALLMVALVLISGEGFHEHFGILMRIALAPVALTRVLFGPVDLSWPVFLILEFASLFVVVLIWRFAWRLATANRA